MFFWIKATFAVIFCLIQQYRSFLYIRIQKTSITMIANLQTPKHTQRGDEPYQYKKIQNYIYSLSDVLGKGNFSTVYRAINELTNQAIAIKVVELKSLTFKKLEELLDQQISILRTIDHPNVLKCYETLKSANNCYIISELCTEGTIESLIKEKGVLQQKDIKTLVMDVYNGLKYMNSHHIVHRDLKSSNIFMSKGVAKIADFGFAVITPTNIFDSNIGTPLCMSPEGYLRNIYGPKTDVWSFGVLLYEMTHGKLPLDHCKKEDELRSELVKQFRVDQLSASLSKQFKQLIIKCLEIDQNLRISIEEIQQTEYIQKIKKEIEPKSAIKELSRPKSMKHKGFLKEIFLKDTTNLIKISAQNSKYSVNFAQKKNIDKQNTDNQKIYHRIPYIRLTKKSNPHKDNANDKSLTLLNKTCDVLHKNFNMTKETIESKEKLMNCSISFNEAIGLIHFCRLGYKLLTILTENMHRKQIQESISWIIITVLKEILEKVSLKQINFDVYQNIESKKQKLVRVVTEYIEKYNSAVGQSKVQEVNLSNFMQTLRIFLKENEIHINQNPINVKICYFNLLMIIFLRKIINCQSKNCFKQFGFNFDLQQSLYDQNVASSEADYFKSKMKYLKQLNKLAF